MKLQLLKELILQYRKGNVETENKLSHSIGEMHLGEYELLREEIVDHIFTICPLLELAIIHYKSSVRSTYLGITYRAGGRDYIDYEAWGSSSVYKAFTDNQSINKCLFNNECTQQQLKEVYMHLEIYKRYFEASYSNFSHLLIEHHLITKVRTIREVNLNDMYF
jgi:hypothetical protein